MVMKIFSLFLPVYIFFCSANFEYFLGNKIKIKISLFFILAIVVDVVTLKVNILQSGMMRQTLLYLPVIPQGRLKKLK